MPKAKRVRKSLSLRLQPYEGTPLAQVADYLNSLGKEEATRRIGEILVMAFLPYASKGNAECKTDKLRSAFLIARDMADKHFGIMALALGLDEKYVIAAPIVSSSSEAVDSSNSSTTSSDMSDEVHLSNECLIEGNVKANDIRKIFG